MLGSLIATLQRNEADVDSALIYVSDHGESLGERNLYLHGLPWFIAPKEQKQVPMVMWLSNGFARATAIDPAWSSLQRSGCARAILLACSRQRAVTERRLTLRASVFHWAATTDRRASARSADRGEPT